MLPINYFYYLTFLQTDLDEGRSKEYFRYNGFMLSEILYSLKKPYHLIKTGLIRGTLAQLKYKFPANDLHISVITGTDGKTTSATMLYHVLKNAGFEVGLLSTVAAFMGNEQIDTGFHVTSPQPDDVHKFMRQLVDAGYTHLVLEITSHGSYQYRNWGINQQISGMTNISMEHLDYHVTAENYLEAKADILKKSPIVVLNENDPSYLKIRRYLGSNHRIIPYSDETKLPPLIVDAINTRFQEDYNRLNARLVYAMATTMGVSDPDFVNALQSFPGIPGRMEKIENKRRLKIFVDFAHTPQGLEAALEALKKLKKQNGNTGRLIAVFGCAGLRDIKKRPIMGEIATRLADIVVFTAEDPRTENVWSIIRQMKEQLKDNHQKIVSIADRKEAIDFTINQIAKSDDIIGFFGKGHEKSMCYGTIEYPWSDQEIIRSALEKQT
jgi:UDP-N-acetylmuramoyl-L-alanyl-D-glutamate--2,6-diaminopimelate ligase